MIPGRVSVVMPCYNVAKYLDDAIHSMRAQTYESFEILAVDDGSTDGTLARLEHHAAQDPRVRVFSQKNAGPSAARNTAMRQVSGEYVCFLDADDVYLPEKIERQLKFLQERPEVDLVYSDYFTGDADLNLTALTAVRFPQTDDMLEAIALRNSFPPMVPLFRRKLMDAVGEYDERYRMTEDWDYWLRAAAVGTFAYLPGAFVIYRTHGEQAHHNLDKMFLAGKSVLRKHFASDRARYERALSSWYERHARARWAAQRRVATFQFLALSALHGKLAKIAARVAPRGKTDGQPRALKSQAPLHRAAAGEASADRHSIKSSGGAGGHAC